MGTRMTIPDLQAKKNSGEKLVAITCYDATFAKLLNTTPIDIILVGDSLGMVIQGRESTIPVTLEEMIYHTSCVNRGAGQAHLVADMPFMSYQADKVEAIHNAGRLLKEAGAHAVKLEGGAEIIPTISAMTASGIPVMGHIGMRPQSVHQTGGYKIQGKTEFDEQLLLTQAVALEAAGIYALVLEGVTIEAAAAITKKLRIPTIGICSGPACDGQILVLYDLLGLNPDFSPKFLKRYANLATTVTDAVSNYAQEVRSMLYPSEQHATHKKSNISVKRPA